MRRVLSALSFALIIAAFWLLLTFVQSEAQQIWHDSCRYWQEPPPWSSFCPPSTL